MTPSPDLLSWGAGGCVLLAVLLLGPPAARRLENLRLPGAPGAASSAGTRRVTWLPRRPRQRAPLRRRRPGRDAPTVAANVATSAGELAVLLRAGLSPGRAWAALPAADDPGVLGSAVRAAVRAAAEAGDVAAAVRASADSAEDPGGRAAAALRALAATWHVAARTGAPTADVLERFADSLRADLDADEAREAALAAPRATARVLAGLPPAGLLLGWLVGADPVGVLLGTAAGRISAAVGSGCALAGWWWTRRLLASAARA